MKFRGGYHSDHLSLSINMLVGFKVKGFTSLYPQKVRYLYSQVDFHVGLQRSIWL